MVSRGDPITCQETDQRAGKLRIGAAIGLALRVRRDRSILLLDGKVGGVVSNVVVTEYRCRGQCCTDLIGTSRYSVTGRAVIGGGDAIGCEESNQCAGKGWISAAVSLTRCIGRN